MSTRSDRVAYNNVCLAELHGSTKAHRHFFFERQYGCGLLGNDMKRPGPIYVNWYVWSCCVTWCPFFFRTTQLTMGFIMSQHKDPDKPTSTMESRMVFQCSFRASSFVQQISNAAPSILCSCLPKPRTRTCIGLSSHWHWAQRYEVTRWRWRLGGFSKQKAPLLFRFIRLKPGFWRWKRSMPPQYICCWVKNIYVYMYTICF